VGTSYSDGSDFQEPSKASRERPTGPSETPEQMDHEEAASKARVAEVKPRQIQGGHSPSTPTTPSHLSVLMGMVGSNSGLLGKAAQALAKSRAAAEGKIPGGETEK